MVAVTGKYFLEMSLGAPHPRAKATLRPV